MATTAEFINERRYLKNVSPNIVTWYQQAFKYFDGAIDSKALIVQRISVLLGRGISATSVNVWLRVLNAYFNWLHKEHGQPPLKIPKLKEEQKILATFTPEQIHRIVNWKPVGRNATRIHAAAITAMDAGIRINELLNLRRSDVDFDNLVLKVLGEGNKHRLVPMSIQLRKVLYRYISKHNFPLVFCTQHGTQLTQRQLAVISPCNSYSHPTY